MTTATLESPQQLSEQQAQDRVLKALEDKPHSVAELAAALGKKPAIGKNLEVRRKLANEIVQSLLAKDRVFLHPVGGRNRSLRYGLAPADPEKYVTKSGLKQFQSVYEKLVKAKVSSEAILAVASSKLSPPIKSVGNGKQAQSPVSTGSDNNRRLLRQKLLDRLTEHRQQSPTTSLPFPDLYRSVGGSDFCSVSDFHDVLRSLWSEDTISLVAWTRPLYTMPEEAFAMIADREIRYYAHLAG